MKIESDNGKIIVFYRDKEDYVIANKFIVLDNTLTTDEFSIEIESIERKLKDLGYNFLHTDPPTFNPYLALFLLNSKNNSRIFANGVEIVRGTEAFDKYKKFLERAAQTQELNCGRVELEKVLTVPVYFSFPLNGDAYLPYRYMEYNEAGKVTDIIDTKPAHKNYKLTTKYFKENLLNKEIIIKGNSITEYKINGNNA
jgi:hypothetical protein